MEISPESQLQAQLVTARDLLPSGLLRETHGDNSVTYTISPNDVRAPRQATDVPQTLVETAVLAERRVEPLESAPPRPVDPALSGAALAGAIGAVQTLIDAPAAAQTTPVAGPADPTSPAAVRQALVGVLTDFSNRDVSEAAAQQLQRDAQRIVINALQTFESVGRQHAFVSVLQTVLQELDRHIGAEEARKGGKQGGERGYREPGAEENPPGASDEGAQDGATEGGAGPDTHPDAAIEQVFRSASQAYNRLQEAPFRV